MTVPRKPEKHRTASDREVRETIEALDEAQLNRLHAKARFLSHGLEGDMSPEDLLQEAMTRTLAGDRRWNPKIHLVVHLMGAMRSVASHLREERIRKSGLGSPGELTEDAAVADPVQDRDMVAKEFLTRLEDDLKGDEKGLAILLALQEGLKGPEIKAMFGYTEKEIEAAKKRIRLRLQRRMV